MVKALAGNLRVLRALHCAVKTTIFGASLAMTIEAMTIESMAQGQSRLFHEACALKEVTVITLIDDHGEAGDLPATRVSNAALTMLSARAACYEGRVSEAMALYDSILDLGPVAFLNRQRP